MSLTSEPGTLTASLSDGLSSPPGSLTKSGGIPSSLFRGTTSSTQLAPYRNNYFLQTSIGPNADSVGEAIGRIVDQTGNGYNANQTTAAAKPTLGTVPRGGVRNRLTYTEQFDNSVWFKTNATVTANSTTAPDGTLTADKLIDNAVNGTHKVQQTASVSSASTIKYSVYLQASELTTAVLFVSEASPFTRWSYVSVDLLAGTISAPTNNGGAVGSGQSIEALSGGWYRCSFSILLGGSTNQAISQVFTKQLSSYVGTGQGLFVWGAQLEVAALSAYQQVTNAYQITESGVPSILMPYYDGGDFLSLGVQAVGTADLFFEAGVPQWCAGVLAGFVRNGTFLAKSGGGATNTRTLQLITDNATGKFVTRARGADTTSASADLTDGLLHTWLLEWDGAGLRLYVDDGAAEIQSVGAAAEEAQNITIGTRTESAPAGYYTGFNDILGIRAGTLSATERTQLLRWMNSYYRGVSI